jgi:hypothetical protein
MISESKKFEKGPAVLHSVLKLAHRAVGLLRSAIGQAVTGSKGVNDWGQSLDPIPKSRFLKTTNPSRLAAGIPNQQ